MKKVILNLGKIIEDATIGLGEKSVGKCMGLFLHEPVIPEELRMTITEKEEDWEK